VKPAMTQLPQQSLTGCDNDVLRLRRLPIAASPGAGGCTDSAKAVGGTESPEPLPLTLHNFFTIQKRPIWTSDGVRWDAYVVARRACHFVNFLKANAHF
jgi:hypothetical protein